MMHATMTDVQQAIEQLGRGDRDARSFSFRSSHGDYSERSETETEDDGDADGEDELGWHRDARARLAQRAQRENEQRQAREAEDQPRAMIPPIDVEVSDESDGDDNDDSPASPRRVHQYPQIAEEDETEDSPVNNSLSPLGPTSHNSSGSIIPSDRYLVPDETDLPTATAMTFPDPIPPTPISATEPIPDVPPAEATDSTHSETPVPTIAPPPIITTSVPDPEPSPPEPPAVDVEPPSLPVLTETPAPIVPPPAITPTPSTTQAVEQLPFSTAPSLPSPTTSSAGSYTASSTAGIQQALTPATTVGSLATLQQSTSSTPEPSKGPASPPSEWSVDDVVDWLKSKGFDQAVCDNFIGT